MKRSINELASASTLPGEISKRHILQPHRSKIDLMDDTRLTSLPLPPPPPKRAGSSSASSTELQLEKRRRDGQLGEDFEAKDDIKGADEDDEDEYDEYEDESQDPIVLVEDYMHKSSSLLPHMSRQKSLAHFKSRIFVDYSSESASYIEHQEHYEHTPQVKHISSEVSYDQEVSDTSFSTLPRNSVSEETVRYIRNSKEEKEDLEAIFGRIPGSDLLKYCDLCDKPLYEISSIINNNNSKQRTIKRNHYEFICGDCIENYETFINEFYDNEEEEEENLEKSRTRLLRIFHSIQYKYKLTDECAAKKSKLSTSLIDRLHLIQAGNIAK
ncbi:uncharacterized protein SPAPADRAFT_66240 [Spathaspora passalidarum NRRL Y-27907]|uniref:Uncharacterized protein n=1 Tax=Spathaspora passalidarum (strain NRRL Y-27907 / 11-Y1) TaxID=619300 RepID=G3ALL5_SPAPN|nr:uncharacterized protein SPAPADRAFT_66240 [Spathaspora passalidarum NRRL Y-27907]EGW33258.1 hypothetical protein SPAPADRAFT_66240 [Spathaspora passalidarum NRRL Y-27907]